LGKVLLALSGLIWTLLLYAIPLLILAGIGYAVVYFLQKRSAA
jgi:flagellar basal body-associated protein FliL